MNRLPYEYITNSNCIFSIFHRNLKLHLIKSNSNILIIFTSRITYKEIINEFAQFKLRRNIL